jgi:SAM-dependent methyltransferase
MTIQKSLSEACEVDLERYGDNFRGVGYTRTQDHANRCYAVMAGLIRPTPEPVTLVDLGCGLAHLLDYIKAHGPHNVRYIGLDLSEKYLAVARRKHPELTFLHADVRQNPASLPRADYIVMNGLFNYRGRFSFIEMRAYFLDMIAIAFGRCARGIAFNVMSKLVDWERDDLFHLPFDDLAQLVSEHLSRHFVVHHDYGMYEYTTYVYTNPCQS